MLTWHVIRFLFLFFFYWWSTQLTRKTGSGVIILLDRDRPAQRLEKRATILLHAFGHCIAHIFAVTHLREWHRVHRCMFKNGCLLVWSARGPKLFTWPSQFCSRASTSRRLSMEHLRCKQNHVLVNNWGFKLSKLIVGYIVFYFD